MDRLQQRFRELNVTQFWTDLDDTLCDTSFVYLPRMRIYSDKIAELSGTEDIDQVNLDMHNCLRNLRPLFSAHPMLMLETARLTAERYRLRYSSKEVTQAVEQLMQIYETIPPLFPGVYDSLQTIHQIRPVIIYSLSRPEWAIAKVEKNGLSNIVDEVLAVWPIYKKDASQMKMALDKKHVLPWRIYYSGDSYPSDIIPALELGVPSANLVRIRTAYDHSNQNKVEGIREIDAFSDIIDSIVF